MSKRFLLVILLASAGCSSSVETAREHRAEVVTDVLREYEAKFTPSDYDSVRSLDSSRLRPTGSVSGTDTTGTSAAEELVAGFRVQLLASTSIDDATALKARAEEIFPDEWFYIEFDPPTYKLRAGNFLSRFDADRFARALANRGFSDAWPVPARVLKNPPLPKRPTSSGQAADTVGTHR